MLNHLFIDSLNALSSELEAGLIHTVTHNKQLSLKMETLTMHLLSFKAQLLQSLSKFIPQFFSTSTSKAIDPSIVIDELSKQVSICKDKLYRYRLHHILKKKLKKTRKNSMMNSSMTQSSLLEPSDIEKSVIMIQKDLGIQSQLDNNQQLAATKLFSRSLLQGLTPVSKIRNNDDSICEVSSLDLGSNSRVMESRIITEPKENLSSNIIKISQSPKKNQQIESKPKKAQLTMKKKKTTLTKNEGKEGLLGNLLQQTYQLCMEKK